MARGGRARKPIEGDLFVLDEATRLHGSQIGTNKDQGMWAGFLALLGPGNDDRDTAKYLIRNSDTNGRG